MDKKVELQVLNITNSQAQVGVRRFWRSIRESNPGTGLPAYRISSFTRFAVLSGT